MSRRTYVWDTETKQLVEVGADWTPTGFGPSCISEEEVYGNLTATDGTRIDTRKRHREYMRANGLVLDSDFKESRAKLEAQRVEALRGQTPSERRERREQIGRALYHLKHTQRKP